MRTGLMTALVVLALAAPSVRAQDCARRGRTPAGRQRTRAARRSSAARPGGGAGQPRGRALRARHGGPRRGALGPRRSRPSTAWCAMGGRRADAALYWKAYAQRKAGRPADALATLAQLRKTGAPEQVPEGRGRPGDGDPPGLRPAPPRRSASRTRTSSSSPSTRCMHQRRRAGRARCWRSSWPAGASPKLRNRALFVLTQSGSPRGRGARGRHRARQVAPRPAAHGPEVPGPLRRRREPPGALRDLRLDRRTST